MKFSETTMCRFTKAMKYFFEDFLRYADRLHSAYLTCSVKRKKAWVSGRYRIAAFGERNQTSARGRASKKAPKVGSVLTHYNSKTFPSAVMSGAVFVYK